jgi:hypothetical protein
MQLVVGLAVDIEACMVSSSGYCYLECRELDPRRLLFADDGTYFILAVSSRGKLGVAIR